MKKIHVEVCVCTACVMNGSVDLMESVESLRELRGQMEEGFMTEPQGELEITTNKCLGGVPHQEDSPVVAVEGKVFKKADARDGNGLHCRLRSRERAINPKTKENKK